MPDASDAGSLTRDVGPQRVTKAPIFCRIDMRELTLVETSYLAGGLLLSLVLPLMIRFRAPRGAVSNRSQVKKVWLGQLLLALAGLAVVASKLLAPYAAVFGVVSCVFCAFMLLREFQEVRPA